MKQLLAETNYMSCRLDEGFWLVLANGYCEQLHGKCQHCFPNFSSLKLNEANNLLAQNSAPNGIPYGANFIKKNCSNK